MKEEYTDEQWKLLEKEQEKLLERIENAVIKAIKNGGVHSSGIKDWHFSHMDLEEISDDPFDEEVLIWDTGEGEDFCLEIKIRTVSRERSAMEDHIEDISDNWDGDPNELREICSKIKSEFIERIENKQKFHQKNM